MRGLFPVMWTFLILLFCLLLIGMGLYWMMHKKNINVPNVFTRGRQEPQSRLRLLEIKQLDKQYRLMLVARDEVEHLILTGGPVDLVLETGAVNEQEKIKKINNLINEEFSDSTRLSERMNNISE